jgi:DNA-binding MarR family transcriptional regulator
MSNPHMRLAARSTRVSAERSKASPQDEASWLKAPKAVALARRFHQICVARVSEALGKSGLTPLEFAVLIHLNQIIGQPDLDQRSLAERLTIDRNTVSVIIEQLVKKDLVSRTVDQRDRRARLLRLTDEGERLFVRLRPEHKAANDDILSPLTRTQQKVFLNLLTRLIQGNYATSSAGPAKRNGHQRQSRSSQSRGSGKRLT